MGYIYCYDYAKAIMLYIRVAIVRQYFYYKFEIILYLSNY